MTGSLRSYLRFISSKLPASLPLLFCYNDEQFADYAEDCLVQAMQKLEDGRKHYQRLNEEGLSYTIVMIMRSAGIPARCEEYHGGHVDVTISHFYLGDYLGECKIYKGPKYHSGGCEQLLNRYMTGRVARGFCLAYFFGPNMQSLIGKIRNYMDVNLPHNQTGPSIECRHKWSFSTTHKHSAGSVVQVVHLGCNLHLP
jgi:hypothetical protein